VSPPTSWRAAAPKSIPGSEHEQPRTGGSPRRPSSAWRNRRLLAPLDDPRGRREGLPHAAVRVEDEPGQRLAGLSSWPRPTFCRISAARSSARIRANDSTVTSAGVNELIRRKALASTTKERSPSIRLEPTPRMPREYVMAVLEGPAAESDFRSEYGQLRAGPPTRPGGGRLDYGPAARARPRPWSRPGRERPPRGRHRRGPTGRRQ
jgi:hypothetical protein